MLPFRFFMYSKEPSTLTRTITLIFYGFNRTPPVVGDLYFNLYIIRDHENEEKGSFFGTRRVSRLEYQQWPK